MAAARAVLADPLAWIAEGEPGGESALAIAEGVTALAEGDPQGARTRSLEALAAESAPPLVPNPHAAVVWWVGSLVRPGRRRRPEGDRRGSRVAGAQRVAPGAARARPRALRVGRCIYRSKRGRCLAFTESAGMPLVRCRGIDDEIGPILPLRPAVAGLVRRARGACVLRAGCGRRAERERRRECQAGDGGRAGPSCSNPVGGRRDPGATGRRHQEGRAGTGGARGDPGADRGDEGAHRDGSRALRGDSRAAERPRRPGVHVRAGLGTGDPAGRELARRSVRPARVRRRGVADGCDASPSGSRTFRPHWRSRRRTSRSSRRSSRSG